MFSRKVNVLNELEPEDTKILGKQFGAFSMILSLVYKVLNLFYSYIFEKFNPLIAMVEEAMNHWHKYSIPNTFLLFSFFIADKALT